MTKAPRKKILTKDQKNIQHLMTDATIEYQKSLAGHAFYKTHNKDLADDLVQTTFLKALLYLQRGGKIETMRIFLKHILHDLIIDEYRRRKTSSLDAMLENGFDLSFDNSDRTIDIFDGKKIISIIDSLPTKYQEVMRMKYLQDFSLTEIALTTGQTKNTTAVQLYRGLRRLKVLTEEDYEKFEHNSTNLINSRTNNKVTSIL